MGIFDDALAVYINNEEVEFIKTVDGNGVIYEKNYQFTLTSDKDYLDYSNTETATLTAKYTINGEGVSGKTVKCYIKGKPVAINNGGLTDFTTALGNRFIIRFVPTASGTYVRLVNSSGSVGIVMDSSRGIIVQKGGANNSYSSTYGYLKLENGVLTDANGLTYNISNYEDFRLNYIAGKGIVYIDFYEEGVTDSNGEVSWTYNSFARGSVPFIAECENRSAECTVEDCFIYNGNEVTLDTSTRTVTNITASMKNYVFSFDYYPTDTWEWLRVYFGDLPQVVLSSSYDKSSNFGLTSLGYNQWVSVEFRVEDDVLTVSSGDKTASEEISLTYPYTISYYPNKNNNKIKNLKVKKI